MRITIAKRRTRATVVLTIEEPGAELSPATLRWILHCTSYVPVGVGRRCVTFVDVPIADARRVARWLEELAREATKGREAA